MLTPLVTNDFVLGTEVEKDGSRTKDDQTTMSRHLPAFRRPSSPGFTLVEILIVMTIIGVVAAMALPSIDYTRYRIDSAMRGVATSLLSAQRAAVTRQHDMIILVDASNNTIRIHDDRNDNRVMDSDERVRAIPLGDQVVLGQGPAPSYSGVGAGPVTFIKQLNGVPALTFHRNGAASEYGGFYLTSRRALGGGSVHASDARLLVVERSTGRVTRYRYNGSAWVEAS